MLEPLFDRIRSQRGLLHETNLYQFTTLKSAYRAIDESLDLQEDASAILGIADTYSQSIIYDLLENVRTFLLKLYQSVLTVLNTYILNHAKLFEKYQDLILERFDKIDGSIRYYTYSYSDLYTYPKDLRSEGKAEKAAEEIIKLGEDPNTNPDDLEHAVNEKIREFSYAMIGTKIDPYNLKEHIRSVCYAKMQGEKYVERLTKENLKQFIQEIREYKTVKSELRNLKTEIDHYYRTLKRNYASSFSMATGPSGELVRLKDPNKAELLDRQVVQFSTAKIQLNRLFNGYITLYSGCFNAKLDIIQQRININKAVIVAVMTRTNVLYAVSGKPTGNNISKYDPLVAEIIT